MSPVLDRLALSRRRLISAIVVVVLAGAGGMWWITRTSSHGNAGRGPAPVAVKTGVVSRKDLPVYLDAIGTVQAYNTVTVRPQVDGQLVEVRFREGQDVKAGDVLARVDDRTYRAAYEQAVATRDRDMAELQSARRDLARYESLGNRVTGQSVDTQRATVKQLEATVRADQAAADSAAVTLGYTSITAPIDGRTGIRQVDKGNLVQASDTTGLVVLTQLQPISVLFTLPQQNLSAISREIRGQGALPVLVVQSDSGDVIETGTLELIDNQIDSTTGTIKLKAVFPNADYALWPGGFVTVRLHLATRRDAVVVPSSAVQAGPKGPYVFLVQPDETVAMRAVTTGPVEKEETLVEQGLETGETIVVDGAARLREGAKIRAAGTSPTAGKTDAGGK